MVAGIVGHMAVEVLPVAMHANKFVSAFEVGVVALLGASTLAATRWAERYGGHAGSSASESLQRSWRMIRASRTLFALGLVNSCYEAALYIFVFLWTPTLEGRVSLRLDGTRERASMGHGLVFSIFMLSKMVGSQVFHALSWRFSPSVLLQLVFSVSVGCLVVPLLSSSYEIALLAFCGFECMLGIYWPAIALLRAGALDDAQRSSTMAVFRTLLNLMVVITLPLAGGLPEGYAFGVAIVLLLVCIGGIAAVDPAEADVNNPSRPGSVANLTALAAAEEEAGGARQQQPSVREEDEEDEDEAKEGTPLAATNRRH